MKFSCVLPVYNTEKETLHQCVSSVLNQTFRDYEIILVDDGSNQNTAFICDCYADQYSNIKVIHQENMGLAGGLYILMLMIGLMLIYFINYRVQ